MRIEGLSTILIRGAFAALPKVVPGFSIVEDGTRGVPQPAVPAPGAQPMPSVQMLVALAAGDPGVERRRKQAVDAERGVDALDRLHREVLAGTPSVERLQEIAEWSQSFATPDDPVLKGIMSEIDLRVRVELAKFDVQA